MDQHLLSIVLFAPLAGFAILLLIPGAQKNLIKVWANLVGFASFLISLPLVSRFDKTTAGFQMVERANWIPSIGAKYLIGIDGIKFFLYTLAGSVLMLLGILTLYFQHFQQFGYYTFEIADLMRLDMPLGLQQWVFWAFFVGFAIKVPMFPFHTWLPDAHVEAPTAGSVILASVLLKMGTYGFLRFSLPLLPETAKNPWVVNVMALLSIIGIVYGALASLMQKDWKKLVAYSSVSHLGFCTLGIFALNPAGIAGSIIQQINHGISTGMLFLIVGIVYERRHTREIAEYGGLMKVISVFTILVRPEPAAVFSIPGSACTVGRGSFPAAILLR